MARAASRGRAGELSGPREPLESSACVRAVRRVRRRVELRDGRRPRSGEALYGPRNDTDQRAKPWRRRDTDHATVNHLALWNVGGGARTRWNRRRAYPTV